MFARLGDFSFVRTSKQAVGFYLVWLPALLLFFFVVGGVAGFITNSATYELGMSIGSIASCVVCTAFAVIIWVEKGMHQSIPALFLIAGTAVLTLIGGAILGLVIPAYLTTWSGKSVGLVPHERLPHPQIDTH